MATLWQTTVDDLVRGFLETLNSLVPEMRRAHILDNALVGFDDWARVTDVLYRILVVEPIRASYNKAEGDFFDLPMYDTEYESYEDFSLIRVTDRNNTNQFSIEHDRFLFRFLTLGSQSERFDMVETFRVDTDFRLIESSFAVYPVDEVIFSCAVPTGQKWEILNEIAVNLG